MINRAAKILCSGLLLLIISSCQKALVPNHLSQIDLTVTTIPHPNDNNSFFNEFQLEPPLGLVKQFRLPSAPQQKLQIQGDILFVSTKDGKLESFSLTRLKSIYRYKLPAGIHANVFPAAKNLLVSLEFSKRSLFLLDPANNHTVWTAELGSIVAPVQMVENRMIAATQFRGVNCLNLSSGKILWQNDVQSQLFAAPVVVDSLVIQAGENGKVLAFDLVDGKLHWEIALGEAILASPVLSDNRLICATREGRVVALSLAGEILWQTRGKGMIRRTPAAGCGKVVLADQDGLAYALDLATGKLVWQYDCHTIIGTTPVLTNDYVYLGTLDNRLLVLRLDSGRAIWEIELFGRVRTDPLPWRDYLIVGSEDNYLYIFGRKSDQTVKHGRKKL